MRFYLGTHETAWLARVDVPLMVSRRRLARHFPSRPARVPWVLDSGGFTELSTYGRWTVSPDQYEDEVGRALELGRLEWVAPQDWMCEPFIVARTGLSVREHQDRTVANYLDLAGRGLPVIPVLQGHRPDEYLEHVDMYADAGVDLTAFATVGLGSVCRREATAEIAELVATLAAGGLRLHGFGCKAGALRRLGDVLASADSLAWSIAGKHRGPCEHLASRCANHLHYAMTWRASVLAAVAAAPVQMRLM